MNTGLSDKREDHALESVPEAARKGWLQISWNTAGLVTTLVMLFFGALGWSDQSGNSGCIGPLGVKTLAAYRSA
ncbi:MAG: hypothetical protein KZQ89_08150 [Candidatus Thiodiazotropha sp. (ex Lucinoma kastoroae)]|nr:hypothetical protein [Candidatus Thiodiazotropha sp. (ex Rostrolucina anterorostrata)]MCU7847968.1 hypothetical protein [Candidatus Thiodiazotropha sp. (ex Lucinoma kastoroae)]MCU7859256.1 hypothetical protein [Candidatus Thiodiazotropha sp. (ex Lucinoma kastoroae)]